MKDSQLEKMPLKELKALQAKVEAAIDEKRGNERRDTLAKMDEVARASGFSVAELFGRRGGKRGKAGAKYRNTKDPNQTWTGRGRRPNWIVEAGGDLKRFLIPS